MRLKASLAPTDSQHVLSDREHCKVQRTLANCKHCIYVTLVKTWERDKKTKKSRQIFLPKA